MNLSSASAKLATTTEAAAYAASKSAILSITRSFAYAFARGMTVDELQQARHAAIPLGRPAAPAELAGYIWFLLSPEAGYITGQSLNYGGGAVTW